MHEMALAEGAMRVIWDATRGKDVQRVTAIRLEIGQLAAVEKEALKFAFDAALRDSIAEGARVEIVEVPGQAWCMRCSEPVTIGARTDACPLCHGYQLQVSGGDQMRVLELEVV